jgi:MerR family transcriptional regulator, copper efflux regulator
MKEKMRIGKLTERAMVTARTVRYYESISLIAPGERIGNGQSYYSEETVIRLKKIEQLKQLGLSLDEVREVIDLYFTDLSGRGPKRKVLAILRQHLAEVDGKLVAFGKFRSELLANIERFEHWFEQHDNP